MGRRKDLTEAEKATIIKEIAKGKTTKSIAERINRHVVTVTRFLQNPSKRKPPSDRGVRKIAEIVMQEIESSAINTSPVPVRWWRRYVDDSMQFMSIRKNDIEQFHTHLNTINKNIQFTIELPSESNCDEAISFLDTHITILKNRTIEVSVYREDTHTNKYLSFRSHNPTQSKRSVVKTLLDRADSIPSTDNKKQQEKERVVQELKLNGYPEKFIFQTSSSRSFSNTNDEPGVKGLSCIPYMKGISEQVKQLLKSAGVRTIYI
jgi:hypothetical protein